MPKVRFVCTGDSEYREEQKKDCGNICCMDCEDDCICQCDVFYMRETKYLGAKITKKQCECLMDENNNKITDELRKAAYEKI